MKDHLSELRKKIDHIDISILEMICKRAELVSQVGEKKKKEGSNIYRPERENEIYQNIKKFIEQRASKLSFDALQSIYREIMTASINLEGAPSIAYLGPEASYSHAAIIQHFGKQIHCLPVSNIPEIFNAVEFKNEADYGIVPVENSSEGSISVTLESLLNSNLNIYTETYLNIHHNLLYYKDVPIDKIKQKVKKLYTLRIVHDQCKEWLAKNLDLSKVEVIETPSSAAAAKMVAERKDGLAIASDVAASHYKLKIIKACIEDNTFNTTRFLLLSKKKCGFAGIANKTSIVFTLKDKPGALSKILNFFAKKNVNLTKIESKSMRRKIGEYYFFIDFLGHIQDKKISLILEEVEKNCSYLKIFGSYPYNNINSKGLV